MPKGRCMILNSPVDKYTIKETLNLIEEAVEKKTRIQHVCVNASKLVKMLKDELLFNAVINSDIISPDGQSIIWASKFLGDPIPERVNGTNLMESLVEISFHKNFKCYFLGAKERTVKKVVDHYSSLYSPHIIGGYHDGFFQSDEENTIVREINNSKSDILFVAITTPKKEIFLNKYKNIIEVPFIMGVGGSFDVIAGEVKRAPVWMQNNGLEWFYRFLQEPRRMWKRYLFGNLIFVFSILKQKFKGRINNK